MKDDLQDIFDAEDAASDARKAAKIRDLAEKLFIQCAPSALDNITLGYCFDAAKRFTEFEESL